MANFLNSARYQSSVGWLAFALGFGLPISTAVVSLSFVAIFILWCLAGDWQNKMDRLRANPGAVAMACLILLAALGMTWSLGDQTENLRHFEKYLSLMLAICLITLPLERSVARKAFLGFALAVVITFVLSYGIRLGLFPVDWFPNRGPENPTVFKLQITHGFFMGLGAFIMLIGAQYAADRRWRWGFGIAAALAACNVMIVQGRTGYLVLAILIVYFFIRQFRWRGVAISVGLVVLAGLLLSQFPESTVASRLIKGVEEVKAWEHGSEEDTSMGARMHFAANGLHIIADHPLIGVGTGGFVEAYRALQPNNPYLVHNPHNQYLLTTAQFGIPGLIALLALFGGLWHAARRLNPAEQLLARGVLLAYAVCNLFNSFLFDHSEVMFFAWSMGLLFGSGRVPGTETETAVQSGPVVAAGLK